MNEITDINNIIQWLLGGIGVTTLVSVLILILVFLGILKLAKGLIIQGLLLIVAWLPSVIVSSATNVQSIVPIRGYGIILFPYVWDVLFGNYTNTEIGYISAVMLFISFIALLHLSIIFCAKWKIKYFYAPLIAYLCMIALGLGLINTHTAIYKAYENYCLSSGVHPLMPIIFVVFISLIMFILYWGHKRKGVIVT